MLSHAVLLTPTSSSHLSPLLSRQQLAPLTPLAATLMRFLASVANKRLTTGLSPLAATLTKNMGWGVLLLTRNPEKDFYPERPSGAEGPIFIPVKGICPEEPAAAGSEASLFIPHGDSRPGRSSGAVGPASSTYSVFAVVGACPDPVGVLSLCLFFRC